MTPYQQALIDRMTAAEKSALESILAAPEPIWEPHPNNLPQRLGFLPRVKKSTKGALAAGTAAVLLLGGAGTLAFWSDSQVVEGGAITSGNLALEAVDDGTWTFNGAPLADVSSVAVVPGDELTFSGEYRILADGDNIQATVGVSGGALSGGGSLATELTPVVTVGGEPDGTLITESDNGDVVTIDLRSEAFDSVVLLFTSDGTQIAQDDDGGGGLNARITRFRLPADGEYVIIVDGFRGFTGERRLQRAETKHLRRIGLPYHATVHGFQHATVKAGTVLVRLSSAAAVERLDDLPGLVVVPAGAGAGRVGGGRSGRYGDLAGVRHSGGRCRCVPGSEGATPRGSRR